MWHSPKNSPSLSPSSFLHRVCISILMQRQQRNPLQRNSNQAGGERSRGHIKEALIPWKNFAFSRLAARVLAFSEWSPNVTRAVAGSDTNFVYPLRKVLFSLEPKNKMSYFQTDLNGFFWLMFWSECLNFEDAHSEVQPSYIISQSRLKQAGVRRGGNNIWYPK